MKQDTWEEREAQTGILLSFLEKDGTVPAELSEGLRKSRERIHGPLAYWRLRSGDETAPEPVNARDGEELFSLAKRNHWLESDEEALKTLSEFLQKAYQEAFTARSEEERERGKRLAAGLEPLVRTVEHEPLTSRMMRKQFFIAVANSFEGEAELWGIERAVFERAAFRPMSGKENLAFMNMTKGGRRP